MKGGQLRHLITIQASTPSTLSAFGEETLVWSTFGTAQAAVQPLEGRERWLAQTHQSEATHQIRMRFLSGVNSTMRVSFDSRIFQILEPPRNTDERRIELVFAVKELT